MSAQFLAAILLLIASQENDLPQTREKATKSAHPAQVTFTETIGPLLKEHCSPCHFEGGKIYDEYPFDRYETARELGKKLNTRLKGENAALVIRWVEQGSPDKSGEHRSQPR